MNFIELTLLNGKKFIGNVALLQQVFVNSEGKTCVVGWNNNGYFEIKETYEEVIRKIDAQLAGVNRF
jgi:uncharacterized protein YlzI (FlbEa/FlbD family)